MGLLSDAGIKATDATGGLLSKAGSAVADKFTDIKARNNSDTINDCELLGIKMPSIVATATVLIYASHNVYRTGQFI